MEVVPPTDESELNGWNTESSFMDSQMDCTYSYSMTHVVPVTQMTHLVHAFLKTLYWLTIDELLWFTEIYTNIYTYVLLQYNEIYVKKEMYIKVRF